MFNEKGNYQYPGDMVKSTYDSNNDGVVNAADSVPWSGVTNTPDTLSGYGIEEVPASALSGVIDIEHIPPSAIERMKVVENDSMRFALTIADVQNGDTVKVTSTNKMYLVVDDDNLDSESGYMVYVAGRAAAVDWAGVENKPETIENIDDILDTSEEESEEGNPITIVTDSAQFAKNTHLTFEPIQDLHGYNHPWPAGGGKNLIPMTVDGIKAVNSGTWSGNSITINGVTFTIMTDNAGNVTGISVNGTASADVYFHLSVSSKTLYSESCIASLESSINPCIFVDSYSGKIYFSSGSQDFTGGESTIEPTIKVSNGVSVSNVLAKPMIRLASESDSTFEPYSNVCPISGLDEVEVKRTGKNLLDPNTLIAGDYNGTNRLVRVSQALEDRIIVIAGEKYGLSIKSYDRTLYPCNLIWMAITDENNVLQRIIVPAANGNVSAVIPQEFDGMRLTIIFGGYANDGSWAPITVSDVISMNPMLERYSDSPTYEYEPYDGQVITESLPTTVYGGTLDLETGELVADMAYDVYDGSSDERWSDAVGGYVIVNALTRGTNAPITNRFLGAVSGNITAPNIFYNSLAYYNYRFGLSDPSVTDLASFKTWLSNNPIQVCCKLAATITYTLTQKQLTLLKGTNHISTNAKTVKVTFRAGQLATLEDVAGAVKIADEHLETALTPILGDFADIETSPAASNHAVGEYMIYDSKLYKVIAAITAGETLTEGTNIQRTTVMAELIALTQ